MGNTYHPPYKSIPFILKQFLSTLSKVNVENLNPSLNGGFIQTFKDFLDTGWGRLPPQKGRNLYLLCLLWNSSNNITFILSGLPCSLFEYFKYHVIPGSTLSHSVQTFQRILLTTWLPVFTKLDLPFVEPCKFMKRDHIFTEQVKNLRSYVLNKRLDTFLIN